VETGLAGPAHEPTLIWEGGPADPFGSAAARPAPYTHPWFSNAAAGTRRLFGSADFQVCGIAGFQTRWLHRKLVPSTLGRPADLEIGDTAGWKPAVRLAQAACKVQGKTPLLDEATCRLVQKHGPVRALQQVQARSPTQQILRLGL